MNKKPLVSVIMPVYNAGDYLSDAIDSVIDQTYKNFELIIINDASTDNSLKIIKKFKKFYPKKIKVINIKTNLNRGGDSCANKGIQKASGKYIARMDADDVCDSERLKKQVEFLENNPNVFLVGTNAHVINKHGEKIGEKIEPLTYQNIKKAYFTFHPLIHPSCMYRQKINGRKFKYEIKYSANNDYYTFFKLLCNGLEFVNLPEKLMYFRIHDKNDTFVNMKEKYLNTLKIRLLMVFRYGYKPTLANWFTCFAQTIVVYALPEKILTQIYFLAKGIKKPRFSFPDIKTPFVAKVKAIASLLLA
ncbi:MAG: glycosyltransferase family 2 protein [Patescibacteria group bacterium]|nr:glycosyltransferase family 2 protein [Patescibacteria group bacterium]